MNERAHTSTHLSSDLVSAQHTTDDRPQQPTSADRPSGLESQAIEDNPSGHRWITGAVESKALQRAVVVARHVWGAKVIDVGRERKSQQVTAEHLCNFSFREFLVIGSFVPPGAVSVAAVGRSVTLEARDWETPLRSSSPLTAMSLRPGYREVTPGGSERPFIQATMHRSREEIKTTQTGPRNPARRDLVPQETTQSQQHFLRRTIQVHAARAEPISLLRRHRGLTASPCPLIDRLTFRLQSQRHPRPVAARDFPRCSHPLPCKTPDTDHKSQTLRHLRGDRHFSASAGSHAFCQSPAAMAVAHITSARIPLRTAPRWWDKARAEGCGG